MGEKSSRSRRREDENTNESIAETTSEDESIPAITPEIQLGWLNGSSATSNEEPVRGLPSSFDSTENKAHNGEAGTSAVQSGPEFRGSLERAGRENESAHSGVHNPSGGPVTDGEYEQKYGVEIQRPAEAEHLDQLARIHGEETVRSWADEGMSIGAMASPKTRQTFRERQDRPITSEIDTGRGGLGHRHDGEPAPTLEPTRPPPSDAAGLARAIRTHTAAFTQPGARNTTRPTGSSGREAGGPSKFPIDPVRTLHVAGPIQAKLEVGSPNDAAEAEADSVAERILEMETPVDENTESEEILTVSETPNTTGTTRTLTGDAEQTVRSSLGRGKPLPKSTRSFFEPRFGRDFSDVRIHTGQRATQAARSIEARAFTLGSNIAFSKGEYRPASREGRQLLAHELTHVIQQSQGPVSRHPSLQRAYYTESDAEYNEAKEPEIEGIKYQDRSNRNHSSRDRSDDWRFPGYDTLERYALSMANGANAWVGQAFLFKPFQIGDSSTRKNIDSMNIWGQNADVKARLRSPRMDENYSGRKIVTIGMTDEVEAPEGGVPDVDDQASIEGAQRNMELREKRAEAVRTQLSSLQSLNTIEGVESFAPPLNHYLAPTAYDDDDEVFKPLEQYLHRADNRSAMIMQVFWNDDPEKEDDEGGDPEEDEIGGVCIGDILKEDHDEIREQKEADPDLENVDDILGIISVLISGGVQAAQVAGAWIAAGTAQILGLGLMIVQMARGFSQANSVQREMGTIEGMAYQYVATALDYQPPVEGNYELQDSGSVSAPEHPDWQDGTGPEGRKEAFETSAEETREKLERAVKAAENNSAENMDEEDLEVVQALLQIWYEVHEGGNDPEAILNDLYQELADEAIEELSGVPVSEQVRYNDLEWPPHKVREISPPE